MYDNELSVAIQMERERAIREARLHHRADLHIAGPRLARLRTAGTSLVRALTRRSVPDAAPAANVAGQSGRSTASCAPRASGSRAAPG
jgi:hypothetical protein